MTTYTVSSKAARQAYERAEEQIRDDFKAGAISEYLAGDDALEYLGEIIRIQQQPRRAGESPCKWYDRISYEIDAYVQKIVDTAVENNVHRVAEENAR